MATFIYKLAPGRLSQGQLYYSILRTEMSILRDDKMRPLFQEAIVTKLAVAQSTTRYQMKAMDIIFLMTTHESLWVKRFGHHSPSKLGIFPK